MNTWTRCTADIFFYDEKIPDLIEDEGYIVRLSEESIEVAYDDEKGAVCYRGINTGDGHYQLTAVERNGRASLHRSPNQNVMEGYWHEGKSRGMWRITLK